MSELLLFLGEHVNVDTLRWRLVDGTSTLRAGAGVPPDDARCEVTRAILHASATHLRSVTVPARQRSQMLRALPYVVEEFVAEDIESQHLALASNVRPGRPARVAAIERTLLDAWLAALADINLQLVSLVPEAALLPAPEERGLVLLGSADSWLFVSTQAAGRFPDDWWPVVIDNLMANVSQVDVLLSADAGVQLDELRRSHMESSDDVGVNVQQLDLRADDWMVQQLQAGPAPLELLQGDYAPPENAPALAGAVRMLGALAAAWLLLFVAVQTGGAWLLDSGATRLRADAGALYRELFPDEQRIVNPVAQMRAHLADGGVAVDGSTFLELFARTAQALTREDVELRNVSYNSSREDASIEILTREFATLERLKAGLDGDGLDVEITSAEQDEGVIRARLRVKVRNS